MINALSTLRGAALSAARARLRLGGLRPARFDTALGAVQIYSGPGGGALGPWVVLHGVGSHATAYGGLLRALRPHARWLMAPDLPGHGGSGGEPAQMRPDEMVEAAEQALQAALEAAGQAEPVTLLGCSLGGALAVKLALRGRLPIKALILCAPAGAPLPAADFTDFLSGFQIDSGADARAFAGRLFHRPPWYTALVAPLILAEFRRPTLRAFFAQIRPEDQLQPGALAEVQPSTLVLWGEGERLLWPAHGDFYRDHLPAHGAFEIIEGAGHSLHLEQPQALAERAARFVSSR